MAAANTTHQERSVQRQLEAKGEAVALEPKHTAVFLVAASTGLLSMWMFPNILIYLSLLSFAVGSLSGMLGTLPNLMRKIGISRQKSNRTGMAVAYLLCLTWFILRKSRVGWIFQNILGGFSITMMLSLFKPSALSMPVLLLSAAFVYDIFFVFGTPYLTPSGESIMEAAATGAALTVNEAVPMMFRMPSRYAGEAVLGFGDVVLPGILATFLRESDARFAQAYQEKLDKKQGDNGGPSPFSSPLVELSLWSLFMAGWRRQHPSMNIIPSSNDFHLHMSKVADWTYYAIAVTGFAIGLQVTFVAMMWMEKGQPALLYLVPCTVLPVVYAAYRRGELSQLWHGWNDPEEAEEDDSDQQQLQQPIDSPCIE